MAKPPRTILRRTGFTLVELSIVLVIIGLLVGGIAALRSYTKNAGLTTMMNESKYFIDAFNQFQTRYTAAPGDYKTASAAWAGAGNGDGNGLIRATGTAPGNTAELYYVFQHLAKAGFISGTYTGAAIGGGAASTANGGNSANVPASAVGKIAFLFDHPDAADGAVTGDALYFDGFYGNILRIAELYDNAGTVPDKAFLTPKEAYQLDDKYDDGQPGTGNVLTPKQSAYGNCASSDTTTAAYMTSIPDKTCIFFIRLQ